MNSIKIEQHFSASPQKLWQAWTDPEIVKLWFGSDPNGTGLDAVLDVRVGGAYAVTFVNSNGDEYTAQGIYQEIELDKKTGLHLGLEGTTVYQRVRESSTSGRKHWHVNDL